MTYGQQPGYGPGPTRPDQRPPGPQPYGQPPYSGSGRGQGYPRPQGYGQGGPGGPGGPVGGGGPVGPGPQHGGPVGPGGQQYVGRPPYGAPEAPYGAPPQYGLPPAKAKRRRADLPTGGEVTDEDERWAVPAYVGLFVGGFVAPAIVYAVKGRTSSFARFHATQALNLSIVMTVCNILAFVLAYRIGLTGLMIALVVLAAESFCIVKAAIGANRYEWYRIPSIIAWPIIR